jgi:hypothetical protein
VRKILTFISCFVAHASVAQIGAQAFDFLEIPVHARLAGLGGVNVSLGDRDINFFHNNPALAGDTLDGYASAGYQFYVGDIGNAMFSYARRFGNAGLFMAGIVHTDYGTIQGYDESGEETGVFSSGETAILVGKTHQIGHFRLGVNLKGVFSNIAGYRASAVVLDVGGIFKHPEHDLIVGLVLKNMGVVISDYSPESTSKVPFDVQAGVTLKPQYMPLRFSLTAYHLVNRNSLNDDAEELSGFKKVASHLTFGAEILLHRNVNALVGYNYLLHQALTTAAQGGGAGVCLGFSLHVKPVEFVFSRNAYTAGNAGYSFTLSTNVNQLLKRRKL